MSFESAAIALQHSRSKGTTLVILLGICNHDGDGGAWPTVATLAKYGRCSVSTVQRAIKELEGLGEIRRFVQAGGNHLTAEHERPNRYQFLLRCPIDCDRSSQHRTRRSAQRVLDLDPQQLDLDPVAPVRGGTPSQGCDPVAPVQGEGVAPVRPKPIPGTLTHLSETNSRSRARVKAPIWVTDRCPADWKTNRHEIGGNGRCSHCHEKPTAWVNTATGEIA